MYSIRDAEGKFVAKSRSKAGAHRATRSSRHLGASVNRAGRVGGLARVILPSGNEAVYTHSRRSAEETIRYGVLVATKFSDGWRERGTDWRRAHESDARSYDRAPLLTDVNRAGGLGVRVDPHAFKAAEQDMRAAKRHGSLMIGQTKVGTVELRWEPWDHKFSLTKMGSPTEKPEVLAVGSAKLVKAILAKLYVVEYAPANDANRAETVVDRETVVEQMRAFNDLIDVYQRSWPNTHTRTTHARQIVAATKKYPSLIQQIPWDVLDMAQRDAAVNRARSPGFNRAGGNGGPPRILTSFSRTTPESAEEGDFSETGWVDEDGAEIEADEDRTLEEAAVRWLRDEGAMEASSTSFHPGVWYMTESSVVDYGTGEQEERAFHLKGFTPAQQEKIFRLFYKGRIGTL